ncbi:ABC transporter permease [Flavitalea flava]
MLINYCRIAFRNLKKHKVFSFINITGLAVGIAIFWMMALYIANELSYDRSFENADRIFRVVQYGSWPTGSFQLAPTAPPLAPALLHDFSEVEAATRIDAEGGGTLIFQEKKLKVDDILFADPSLFTLFRYPFLYGDPHEALAKPQSIVLTQSLAEKLFGRAELALDKTIQFQNGGPVLVTGVIRDIPQNSHLSFSALCSMPHDLPDTWNNSYVYTYLLLHKGADANKLAAKFPAFYERHFKDELKKAQGGKMEYRMELQSLPSIHLHSNLGYEIGRNGDIRYIILFSSVALLVLLIALINYVNLATARSSIRVKEVGIRKVVGSGRKQLILLFLSESVLFTLFAVVIAGLLSDLILSYFNQLSGKMLTLWQFGTGKTMGILAVFTLITGVAGGIYPALFLSRFRTIPALKGQQGNLSFNVFFRKSLVTFQFVITIMLIASCCVIYQQLHYVLNRDLGFNKDQVLSFHISDHAVRSRVETLKVRLLQNPLIEAAAAASNPIGDNNIGSNTFNFEENGQIAIFPRMVQAFMIDADYLHTLQIKLLKGRGFSTDRPADKTGSVLVNETLVKELGWADPIGKRVQSNGEKQEDRSESLVIGVVKDFNIYSLQHRIEPLVLKMPPVTNEEDNLYVRVNRTNVPAAIKYIEETYRQFDAQNPFAYHFLDQNFAAQYEAEKKQGSILFIFAALAIFIACLGLFGLVTFTAEQRTKEIGVRKVLGASLMSIVRLLSKDLVKLVAIAVLVATPLAWLVMHKWLESFAYRVSIGLGVFLLAGVLAILIAVITISVQAIRAALANPIQALRNE